MKLKQLLIPFNWLFILIIKVYQITLSPWLGQSCRHSPTCSAYAIQAFTKYNFFTAFYLVAKRVLSCHPWGSQGYDPLP
jgi:putative membrane protein insertion efficiency factor